MPDAEGSQAMYQNIFANWTNFDERLIFQNALGVSQIFKASVCVFYINRNQVAEGHAFVEIRHKKKSCLP